MLYIPKRYNRCTRKQLPLFWGLVLDLDWWLWFKCNKVRAAYRAWVSNR